MAPANPLKGRGTSRLEGVSEPASNVTVTFSGSPIMRLTLIQRQRGEIPNDNQGG